MFDLMATAKDLIKRGQELNDNSLIQMGHDLISSINNDETEKIYECSECGNTMEYDKPGRKKCLKCKKNSLIAINKKKVNQTENDNQFEFQIRKKDTSRTRYDENGNPTGKYTKAIPVEGVTNVWQDDLAEGFDEENERLKKITRVSARTRQPTKLISVTCSECNNTYQTHPIHISGRSKFTCDRCIRRRSRI